jgi:hypothetical protein
MHQLIRCTACDRHMKPSETSCPHCQAKVPTYRGARLVRQAKIGALLAFTAATTAACYGGPPPYTPVPRHPPAASATPGMEVPTTGGTAYIFVTPTNGLTGNDTLLLNKVTIDGARISLTGINDPVDITIELPTADALQQTTPVTADKLKLLFVRARYFQQSAGGNAAGEYKDLILTQPGGETVTGTVQILSLDDTHIAGKFDFTNDKGRVQMYFNALR